MDLCTKYFSFKPGVFVLFFRKRLTIQEALSHPWITVRLNKETDLGFFREQSRDHILTLTCVVNGKLPPEYFVMLGDSKRCTGRKLVGSDQILGFLQITSCIIITFKNRVTKLWCLLHITVSLIGLGFAFFHSSLFAWAYTVCWL